MNWISRQNPPDSDRAVLVWMQFSKEAGCPKIGRYRDGKWYLEALSLAEALLNPSGDYWAEIESPRKD